MLAFHSDQAIKDKYLARVRAHRESDEIAKGYYWEDGKGCAVGCTIHGPNHKAYETELGIPEWLARVEDTIFEGLPLERAKVWPEQFLSAIKPGADLEKVKPAFLIFVMQSTLDKFDHEKFPDVKKAVDRSIALWQRDDIGSPEFCNEAAWAAAAALAAATAAEAAALAATEATAAAWAAEAEAAALAAEAAAWAATEAAATARARAAEAAAEAEYVRFADRLLELLREA